MKFNTRVFSAAAIVACAAALSACGGGGSSSSSAAVSTAPGQIIDTSKCLATAGPFDAAQNAIVSGLGGLTSSLPQGASVASSLTNAASHLLDTPDAVVAALQNLAANHDPAAFAAELTSAGDGLRCGLAYTDSALLDLTQQLQNQSASVPALPSLLSQVEAIETMLGQGLTGQTDLTNLTNALGALQTQLERVNSQLPAGFKIPNISLPMSMIGNIATSASVILQSVAHLDAGSAQGAITGLALQLAGLVNGYSALGLPGAVVQPIYSLLLSGNTQFVSNIVPYIGPLFTAITRVLQSQSNPLGTLQQIVMGGLSGVPASGAFASLLNLLNGGGTSSTGAQIPLLSDLLALLIPGGVPL
ncbi:MAG TPA: hypothetical protein VHE37_09380 [Nevskiaceae bacterium]|nr:hypothetical protein [Nevskiaceae bacterium]